MEALLLSTASSIHTQHDLHTNPDHLSHFLSSYILLVISIEVCTSIAVLIILIKLGPASSQNAARDSVTERPHAVQLQRLSCYETSICLHVTGLSELPFYIILKSRPARRMLSGCRQRNELVNLDLTHGSLGLKCWNVDDSFCMFNRFKEGSEQSPRIHSYVKMKMGSIETR